MTTTCPSAPAPLGTACANGWCVNSTVACGCPAGWTDQGDLSHGGACFMNVAAVQAIWGVCCASWVVVAAFAVRLICGHKVTAAWAVGVAGLGQGVLLSVLGGLRAAYPDSTGVGLTPACTVLFALGSWLFWIAIVISMARFVDVNVAALRFKGAAPTTMSNVVDIVQVRGKRILAFVTVLLTIGCFAPLFMLVDLQSDSLVYGLAVVHFWSLAVVIAVSGFNTAVLTISIEREIRTSILDSPAGANTEQARLARSSHVGCAPN